MLLDYTTLERPKPGANSHTIITLSASGPRHCCLIGTWHCVTLLLQSKAPIVTASPLHCILDLNYSMRILALPSYILHQERPQYLKAIHWPAFNEVLDLSTISVLYYKVL